MKRNRMLCSIGIAAFGHQHLAAQKTPATLPAWVVRLIAAQHRQSKTVVEEGTYQGRRVFEVLPSDRAPDSGNEHVLHAEDGHVICEFGGIAGQVTRGRCNVGQINFSRTLFPKHTR